MKKTPQRRIAGDGSAPWSLVAVEERTTPTGERFAVWFPLLNIYGEDQRRRLAARLRRRDARLLRHLEASR